MTVKMKPEKNWYKINNDAQKPELLIYGFIGTYDEVDFLSFQANIKELAKSHKEITVRIHSGGGSVIDGLPIYDSLRTSGMKVTTVIDGMAASMASVLSQAGDIRQIHENGMLMIHKVKGGVQGTSEDILAYAKLVADRESKIKNIFIKTTKQTEETVNKWFANTSDWWIDAIEALKLGLVDEIIKDGKKPALPVNKITKLNEHAAFQLLSNSVDYIEVVDYDENRPYVVAIKTIGDELNNVKLSRAELLINTAISDGKLKEDRIEYFSNMAIENYEQAAGILAELPAKPKNVLINIGYSNSAEAKTEDKTSWTLEDYRKKDPNSLKENPDLYQKLLDKDFNKNK